MNLNKGLARTGIICIGLLAALHAHAGRKETLTVFIDDTNRFAIGDLGAARNSADSTQGIGCTFNTATVLCFARNSAGLLRTCVTSDAALMAVARLLVGDSSLQFGWENGVCTTISVRVSSQVAPKLP